MMLKKIFTCCCHQKESSEAPAAVPPPRTLQVPTIPISTEQAPKGTNGSSTVAAVIPSPTIVVITDHAKPILNNEPTFQREPLSPYYGKHHLIVDDSDINRIVLRKYLERVGISIIEATNGDECLKISAEQLENVDTIWMDIRMPFKDGLETTTELRQRGYKKYIIGLTGHVESESLAKCHAVGMDKVLAKPVVRKELYGLLEFLYQSGSSGSNSET